MPSWDVHRIVCEKLIGFYEQEIDKIVDTKSSHDSSRYDVKNLAEVVDSVYNEYGVEGLKQLILHHYLDRTSDILVRELLSHYELYISRYYTLEESYSNLVESISDSLDTDPDNILNLFIAPYYNLVQAASILHHGKRRRGKRKKIEQRLAKAYDELPQFPGLMSLSSIIVEIIYNMKINLKFIILSTFENDKKIDERIINSFIMSRYWSIYSPDSEEARKKLIEQAEGFSKFCVGFFARLYDKKDKK